MASHPAARGSGDGQPVTGLRTVAVVLLAVGTFDAVVMAIANVDGWPTTVGAMAGLAGVPLYLLGRRRPSSSPPLGQPAPAGGGDLDGDERATVVTPADRTVEPRTEEARRNDVMLMHRRRRLQAVITAGEGMVMVFQPIIDLRDGHCVGHEALARFSDGRPANEWFDEAHSLGVGVELEMTAIEHACEDFDGSPGYLSINLSPATLVSSVFLDFMGARTDPVDVVVELTEHAVVDDYQEIEAALSVLRELGARFAVDDAGSGISSLRHIVTLAPDIIKLDRSLIATIDSDPARRALALSLAQFATGIGAVLVAEGVERAAEMTTCYESGVRYGQGYLLGRPGPLGTTPRIAGSA